MLPHLHTGYTGGGRISKTVQFPPHNGAMRAMSSADTATNASRRLSDALANPVQAAPFARFGAHNMDAIRQQADIFLQPAHQHQPLPHPQGAPLQLYKYP